MYHKKEVVLGFYIIPFKFVSAHNDHHPIKDSTPHEKGRGGIEKEIKKQK